MPWSANARGQNEGVPLVCGIHSPQAAGLLQPAHDCCPPGFKVGWVKVGTGITVAVTAAQIDLTQIVDPEGAIAAELVLPGKPNLLSFPRLRPVISGLVCCLESCQP